MRRSAALVGAAILALIVWLIAVPVLGLTPEVGAGATAQTIGPLAIVIVPLLAGGVAWALLAGLERMSRRGRRTWQIIGWAVLAVSLLGPLLMGATGGVLVALLIMHVLVGATLILGLAQTAPAAR
ncbi:DUF6069 family protein [Microbacterium elymi]|uniref:DUF6069 family protein n=1 Tax=Microbacterium elymi TaxID=2909587 RepID=A0ABY5NNB1_9MICO|nr:DUF6069 family protein [Microbacterium elymi]UUT36658.1 DUF6069 family protein [Microbacterium elymi]